MARDDLVNTLWEKKMGKGAVFSGFLAVAMLACLGGTVATEYIVGGSRGWTAPPNITAGYYDEWAASKNFTGGDVLKFESNGTHNYAPVSREDYNNCTKVGLVFEGPVSYVLPADANGMYYFICTIGTHCKNGQKLAITVESPNSSASSTTIGALSVLVLLSLSRWL